MKTNLNNFLFIGDSFTERLASTIRSNNDLYDNIFNAVKRYY